MTPALLADLLARRAAKAPTVVATRLTDGMQSLMPSAEADPELARASDMALRGGRSVRTDIDGVAYFLDLHLPPPRLLLVGGVHIAQSLAPMAASFGIEPTVIDPRQGFANGDRFPGIALCHDWPDDAMSMLSPDSTTAVVVLSHDPKLDDPGLVSALRSEAFYIGALGAGRSHAARLERLRAAGIDEQGLARVRGPVGLAIGAVTTGEIALSILAEIVAVRRSGRAALR